MALKKAALDKTKAAKATKAVDLNNPVADVSKNDADAGVETARDDLADPGATGGDTNTHAATPQPNVLASAVMLMLASPLHRYSFVSDLEMTLLPPLALQQFRLFVNDSKPVAFATWAFVSDEVQERFENTADARLKPNEWKSGENCWIVDVVAPGSDPKAVIQALKEGPLSNTAFRECSSRN